MNGKTDDRRSEKFQIRRAKMPSRMHEHLREYIIHKYVKRIFIKNIPSNTASTVYAF